MKGLAGFTLLVAAGAFANAIEAHPSVRINWTPSMPEGVYLASYGAHAVSRGQIVLVCLPTGLSAWAQARSYIGHGDCPDGSEALLKTVAAVPGDVVRIGPDGLAVNTTPQPGTAALPRDREGRDMPGLRPGEFLVTPGSFWVVAARDPHSFDSRYFGALPDYALLGVAHPLITF